MADDDQRTIDARQRVQGGLDALVESSLGILQRQVGDHDLMTALHQVGRQLIPARGLVPGAVDETEGGHQAAPRNLCTGCEDGADHADQGDDDRTTDPEEEAVDRLESVPHLFSEITDVLVDLSEARINLGETTVHSAREVVEPFVGPG